MNHSFTAKNAKNPRRSAKKTLIVVVHFAFLRSSFAFFAVKQAVPGRRGRTFMCGYLAMGSVK
jgi:hypothetical protein